MPTFGANSWISAPFTCPMIRSFPAAAARALAEPGRDARGDVVEGAPGGSEQRDLPLALGLGHRVLLRSGGPAREAVVVGHPDPLEPLDHLKLARGPELGAEASPLGDRGVAGPIGGEDRDLAVIVLTQRAFDSPEAPKVHRDIQAAAYAALG